MATRSDGRRVPGTGGMAIAIALAIVAATPALRAAQTTWADGLGLCNGETPCFLTIGEALANAGPGAATVFVFPGVYAESVDLATMGSAIGGGPAAIELISVDAAGVPTPGAAVNPAAPGGPGTGPAIGATSFPAAVRLEGFDVVSPDSDGIQLLFGSGPVVLHRITADGSSQGNGISVVNDSGDVAITASGAHLNGDSGIVLFTMDGTATAVAIVTERNEGGLIVGGRLTEIGGVHAEANGGTGVGVFALAGSSEVSVHDVESVANGNGIFVASITEGVWITSAELDDVRAEMNLEGGIAVVANRIAATDLHAAGNGMSGIILQSAGDPALPLQLEVDASDATDNAGFGFILSSASIEARELVASGNVDFGIWFAPIEVEATILAEQIAANGNGAGIVFDFGQLGGSIQAATLRDSEANGNLDDGILAGGERIVLERVTAEGNGDVGITAIALDVTLDRCRSLDNRTGYLASGNFLSIRGCSASGNAPAGGGDFDGFGFVLVNAGLTSIVDSLAFGNDLGWLLLDLDAAAARGSDAAAIASRLPAGVERFLERRTAPQGDAAAFPDFDFETSRTEESLGASMEIALGAQRDVRIRCSNFVGNGSAGLALFTDNEVEATVDFWGDASGPTHPANPGGSGDTIHDAASGFAGTVSFLPFLDVEATAADCPRVEPQEIPALGPSGLAALAVLFALLVLARLRRGRRALPAARGPAPE
ncbi:MAG: hypothetical protein AB7G12_13700 [Thermoanaerobaculia bacterium]